MVPCHWTQFAAPSYRAVMAVALLYTIIGLIGIIGNSSILYIWYRWDSRPGKWTKLK